MSVKIRNFLLIIVTMTALLSGFIDARSRDNRDISRAFIKAKENGILANEGFSRCLKYVRAWLKLADPATGLIPRNTRTKYWNAKDAAADNYPFMVLTAALTDRKLFTGRMLEMLKTEIKLTSRVDSLPDTFDFKKQGFENKKPDMKSIMFGSSEYIKDGLLPLTEWLGPSPWCGRMISILDDMWKHAPIDTPYGKIVSTSVEVNGEMLQALSRIYWMKNDKKYLEWAVRLGDYYLLGEKHPTRNSKNLRLRDHGCEIISGLCELYATVSFALPEKKKDYQKPLHEMLDCILEKARNADGLFYDIINPVTGEVIKNRIADTWGYTLNGFYTVFLIDKIPRYRDATIKALSVLNEKYCKVRWEGKDKGTTGSADGYADSIESALNLYNRERIATTVLWLDSETREMWSKQKPDGIIEGWHGDGNFARTTIMYCLWKTAGLSVQPWREDLIFGAVQEENTLFITITSSRAWKGRLIFDIPRHRINMKLPMDWPRINQFPEWFCVESDRTYKITDPDTGSVVEYTGKKMHEGIPVELKPGQELHLQVSQ